LPPIVDDVGDTLKLNRGQREQLKFALRHRSARTRVLLRGGRTLQVDPRTGQPYVLGPGQTASQPGESAPADAAPSTAKHRPAGSKTSKSN
jgi:hypothetical protein